MNIILNFINAKQAVSIKLIVVVLFAYLISCSEGDLDIGQDFIDYSSYTALIDSVSIQLSTIKDDSVSTSAPKNALIGHYQHPLLGNQECRSFLPINAPTNYTWEDKEVLDSISLILRPSSYFLGDTSESMTINVHLLNESIEVNDDDYLSNNSSFEVIEDAPLGSYTFKPKPNSGERIEINLNTDFAERIIEFIQEYKNDDEKADLFRETFYGLRLSSTQSASNGVIGISTSDSIPYLRLYSHVVGLEKVSKYRDIELNNSSTSFNQIINYNQDNVYNQISTSKQKLVENESEGLSILQAGSGYKIRIDFPYLNNLLELKQLGHVIKAELHLIPDMTLQSWQDLPGTIYLSELDKNNVFQSYIVTSNNDAITPILYTDQLYDENSYYVCDISDYINALLSLDMIDTGYGLCMTLPVEDLSSSLDGLILKGNKSDGFSSKLHLYYYYYDKK